MLFTPYVSLLVFLALDGDAPAVFVAQVASVVLAALYYSHDPAHLTYKDLALVRRVTNLLPPSSWSDRVLWAALHAQHIGPAAFMFSQFDVARAHVAWVVGFGVLYVVAHELVHVATGKPAYPIMQRQHVRMYLKGAAVALALLLVV